MFGLGKSQVVLVGKWLAVIKFALLSVGINRAIQVAIVRQIVVGSFALGLF